MMLVWRLLAGREFHASTTPNDLMGVCRWMHRIDESQSPVNSCGEFDQFPRCQEQAVMERGIASRRNGFRAGTNATGWPPTTRISAAQL